MSRIRSQRGAVSLFIVIFTSLLVTIITISFVQLMVRDQRQATYSDLSGSAYDSANAGVEDAKRALLMQQECIGSSSEHCAEIRAAISAGECSTLSRIFDRSENERAIVSTEEDFRLEQAYTCVKIKENTEDYLGVIDQSSGVKLVQLRGVSNFNSIKIRWALSKEGGTITLPPDSVKSLPQANAWLDSYPALLRAQFISGQGSFSLADLDTSATDGKGSNTLFLYPSRNGLASVELGLDGRRDAASGDPQLVRCEANTSSGEYACSVTIDLGATIPAGSETAFLNLMAFYGATDYKVELMMNETVVAFEGVQPEVDSTGRANDLFRRVVSRVELSSAFTYPTSALEIKNDICKDFSVALNREDYNPRCEP